MLLRLLRWQNLRLMAIVRKKESSIVVGMNMVKKKEADAFVSAGSSGAVLVGGQVIVGRIKVFKDRLWHR